jgi:uncharacterized repeat protein (TIGR03803 family)
MTTHRDVPNATFIKSVLVALAFLVLLPASPAQTGNKTTIHNFNPSVDGTQPSGRLIFDKTGALYGTTTSSPGPNCYDGDECGTVYKLLPPLWKEAILYTFGDAANDGNGRPYNGVALDQAGNIYGSDLFDIFQLTPDGSTLPWSFSPMYIGAANPSLSTPLPGPSGSFYFTSSDGDFDELGSVIQLTPQNGTWFATTLYTFTGQTDGYLPNDGVISDRKGNLYGTTEGSYVNPNNCGTIYELTPNAGRTVWTQATIHIFSGPDGCGGTLLPMIFDTKGNLYGTSESGGSSTNCIGGCGVVFELSPPATESGDWQLTVLYSFRGGNDGNAPQGLAIDSAGVLYGTTIQGGTGRCDFNYQSVGCGTVYQLSPSTGISWTKTTLHNFQAGKDGAEPYGGVTIGPDGALYGTTFLFGEFIGGTVFRIPR